MRLEPLAELKLAYGDTPFLLVQPYGSEEGTGWGGGTGTIEGDRIRGRIEWLNVPHRRSDVVMLPHCHGLIQTDDDAKIVFFLEGRTPLAGPESGRQLLRLTFETDASAYDWVNTTFSVAEGIIAEDPPGSDRYVMRARVYACVHELE